MKLNKITLAIVAAVAAPLAANAGVTVTPLLLGYHYSELDDTNDKQREVLRTGKNLNDSQSANSGINNPNNGGISKESGLYTGAALGIELTPNTQFQVEYGVSNTDGQASDKSAEARENRFDVEQQFITGNFLLGSERFNSANGKLRPYLLVGAGQSKIKVENQETYTADANNGDNVRQGQSVPAGTEVDESTDTIGNLGLGAFYRVNDVLSLRGEARAIHNFDNNWWEGLALGGVEVVLGGHLGQPVVAPAPVEPTAPTRVVTVDPAPAPMDSDGDGVIDELDQCPNTPSNIVVDQYGCPAQVMIDDELKMELRVFFDNDKSVIKEQYRPEIAKVAEKMREYPNATASIEGHASKTGPSAAYNQRLSEARAIAVKNMLTAEFGVAPNRLSTVGYGYDRPIAPNDTEEGRAMNRRVYAVITGNKTMTVDQTKDMDVR